MALTDNIIRYYKLDGNSTDSVGGYNGTDTNVTYSNSYGKINQGAGVFVQSSTTKISAATTGLPTGANQRSSSIWVYSTARASSGGLQVIFGYGADSNNQSYGAYINYTGELVLWLGGTSDRPTGYTLPLNTWVNLVITYSGTNAYVYINGNQVYTTSITISTGSSFFLFGVHPNSSSWGHVGYLDEIAIWNRQLTSTEVTQLYNSGAGLQYPFLPKPKSSFMAFM